MNHRNWLDVSPPLIYVLFAFGWENFRCLLHSRLEPDKNFLHAANGFTLNTSALNELDLKQILVKFCSSFRTLS